MSRHCELTAKGPQVGHKVSHSNIKTKRRFLPNLRNVTLISDALGRKVRVRVSANALKSVDHRGGLDAFLLKASDADLARAEQLRLEAGLTYGRDDQFTPRLTVPSLSLDLNGALSGHLYDPNFLNYRAGVGYRRNAFSFGSGGGVDRATAVSDTVRETLNYDLAATFFGHRASAFSANERGWESQTRLIQAYLALP